MVAFACHLSYAGGQNQHDCGIRAAQSKKLVRQDPISTEKSWAWWYVFIIPVIEQIIK
jgi:hypothetical protein